MPFSIAGWIGEKQGGKPIGRPRWIGIGLLLGFAALTRLDGLLLGVILIPILWFFRGRNQIGVRGRPRLSPGASCFRWSSTLLAYGIVTGIWDPQIGQRSYLAFEQGHNFLYTDRYEVIPSPSSADLYGTAEENGYSVLRAIARNPEAFLSRLPRTAANAARMFYDAYSILGGAMFLFLAAGGALACGRWPTARSSDWRCCGACRLAGYALASYRPGFFGMLFPVLLTLVVAGAVPVDRAIPVACEAGTVAAQRGLAAGGRGMLGAQRAFAAGQFRGWSAHAAIGKRSTGAWLTELSEQVPRGECVICLRAPLRPMYSNHAVYGNWQIFYEAHDPDALRSRDARSRMPLPGGG